MIVYQDLLCDMMKYGLTIDKTNQQLDNIVEDKDAKNTKRSTNQAVRLFRKYLTEKELDVEFENYDPQTLNNTLGKFYSEARTEDKKSSQQTLRLCPDAVFSSSWLFLVCSSLSM
jgi:hypothetical protein